ncbi:hypothetical protein GM418_02985 [Maribellus comscasis]|uniref:Uncharacterized protein n=1 Tax=Maribellus comscasis TaxID=2681766 RepID=A0A6I6JIH2_9BACT|nr:hypothetical protein [Maribellus comscasis]QGY42655.1 hypothetical protein GM418_02985 [Maribellus comscasis]
MMEKFHNMFNQKMWSAGIVFLLLFGIILHSCKDEFNEGEETFEGYGDIFIQKKKVGDETLYAPYYHLIANSSIESAMVETPNGELTELEPYEYLTTYIKEPEEDEFSTSMMAAGTYRFTGSYGNNKTFAVTDMFDAGIIDFPKIDSVSYDNTNYYIYLSWEAVSRANIYKVNLLSQAGNIVFSGAELTSESNAFLIGLDTEGWISTPYTGDVLTIQLHAYLLDSNADDDNWYYNIECNSYTETQVIWGE